MEVWSYIHSSQDVKNFVASLKKKNFSLEKLLIFEKDTFISKNHTCYPLRGDIFVFITVKP